MVVVGGVVVDGVVVEIASTWSEADAETEGAASAGAGWAVSAAEARVVTAPPYWLFGAVGELGAVDGAAVSGVVRVDVVVAEAAPAVAVLVGENWR